MFGIYDYLHQLVDQAFAFTKLVQNREVGWLTVDRKTGHYKREKQPTLKKLKLLVLFNPLMEWIDRTHLLRLWTHEKNLEKGRKEGTPQSRKQIKSFIDFYQIDMSSFEPSDPEKYETFEDFFVRKHAPGAGPIFAQNDPTKAIAVADSRVVVYPTVEATRRLWIKGSKFTIDHLIKDRDRAKPWENGAVASFRLSPQDYHRYHSPVEGKVQWYKQIPGDYFQVDPIALQSSVNILTENARCCVCIETEDFGLVLFVAIGATDVGTVGFHEEMMTAGHHVKKGDEIGLFQFGGSSILVAFEKDRIQFDQDLEQLSHQQIMVNVEVGMSLGKATQPKAR
ncbi:putative phosphatidylserine decarboxylase [Aspergillus clavatus NRRL 1]|uniref:phosphatidylserine decarboxylase n=1 Tax=Aspergillus clavatus (strain ATCC 1007 / CBS 513.65 / DSM 816 / NCTC 3887 / NRRL 1 / QM 1276 / 107) TaxID=344612 RepID=A1CND3_ASPCL|nr:phosphatidylserine decarboxylase, putative [Aspergillus clavatus NRRL 1]EAW07154.1 phosphatidylserine decarboxylase, putative [Aspergillus clavatus NRRL 1]